METNMIKEGCDIRQHSIQLKSNNLGQFGKNSTELGFFHIQQRTLLGNVPFTGPQASLHILSG